jgi:transcriptional regulator with XRE-family HTH domain
MFGMTLGQFIKRRRIAAGASLADLREATGQKTWHGPQSWEEAGVVPKAGTLNKIADFLNLSSAERRELLRLSLEAEDAIKAKRKSRGKAA